jgi:hypothetical protein
MQGQNQAIRVRAIRGFYALREGAFGVVNPGDVVDLASPSDAKMLRANGKAEFVDAATVQKRIQVDYLPARKKDPTYGKSPQELQMLALSKAVEVLQAGFEKQSELITKLLERDAEKPTKK